MEQNEAATTAVGSGSFSATQQQQRAQTLLRALESKDPQAYIPLLAEDIAFYSPVEAEPMRGKQQVSRLLSVVFDLFDDFHYTGQADGKEHWHVLHFRAHVADTPLEGVDLVRFNGAGLVSEFTVLLRPLAALNLLHREIGARLGPPPTTDRNG